jgi:hypothetical protein
LCLPKYRVLLSERDPPTVTDNRERRGRLRSDHLHRTSKFVLSAADLSLPDGAGISGLTTAHERESWECWGNEGGKSAGRDPEESETELKQEQVLGVARLRIWLFVEWVWSISEIARPYGECEWRLTYLSCPASRAYTYWA